MNVTDRPQIIPLWPNGAPGSEDWTHQEQETMMPGGRRVRNVAQPTLTAFLPDPSKAIGTAVIVCPGGAYHFLAIEHEGTDVARWLNQRGVAAFILKYRLIPTAANDEDFQQQVQENLRDRNRMGELMKRYRPLTLADGRQAVKVVREHASEWGIIPNRIGMLGFSAGGGVTTDVALEYDADSRPDFAAPIYPVPREDIVVPTDAPPLFLALASDDQMASMASIPLYSAWRAAGHSAELHIYSQGGHGFGMRKQGLPSDHWIERFADWLQAQGFLA